MRATVSWVVELVGPIGVGQFTCHPPATRWKWFGSLYGTVLTRCALGPQGEYWRLVVRHDDHALVAACAARVEADTGVAGRTFTTVPPGNSRPDAGVQRARAARSTDPPGFITRPCHISQPVLSGGAAVSKAWTKAANEACGCVHC